MRMQADKRGDVPTGSFGGAWAHPPHSHTSLHDWRKTFSVRKHFILRFSATRCIDLNEKLPRWSQWKVPVDSLIMKGAFSVASLNSFCSFVSILDST